MSHPVSSRTFNADSFGFRQFADAVQKDVPAAEIALVTALPRGGLQMVQPTKISESFLKAYNRDWHAQDDASWKAISTGKPARSKPGTRFVSEFLEPFGYRHTAAACVSDPVLPGYPGAIVAMRGSDHPAFTSEELQSLSDHAESLAASLGESRASRIVRDDGPKVDTQPVNVRQFVVNAKAEALVAKPAFDRLEPSIRQQMVRETLHRVGNPTEDAVLSERLQLTDGNGDNWTVNATLYREYPAIDAGPVMFLSLLPACNDWAALRPGDLAADAEMSRLVPSMRFMQQEFQRGPTLTEIAKTVHLSPFHFHRRFTELFGLTPKHFLLECQIHVAKQDLMSGEKELSKIASDCGFAHQSHFTSRFKQATGLTPTRWRRMAASRAG
jgi:AraC-like DNA-binding protein